MAQAYWNDLRRKLLEAHEQGRGTLEERAEEFGVSLGYAKKISAALRPGQVVVDNLSAHKLEGVRQRIEAAGAQRLYLPPYSPDLNPIEQNSKGICARPSRARRQSCRKPSPRPCKRSRLKTPQRGFPTAVTVYTIKWSDSGFFTF